MDESQFRHLLRLGLGRAILYVRDHDARAFQSLILDACLHCFAYAPQIEGTRADYMLQLAGFMPEKEFYHQQVLSALPGSGDDFDAMQRFGFAASLAFEGSGRAKEAMYQNYKPGPRMGDGIGIYFVQMDGIDGLLFAARKMGELLMATREKVDLGWLLSVAGEELGEEKVREALRRAGSEDPAVDAYRLAVEASQKRFDESPSEPREIENLSYDRLKPKLTAMTSVRIQSWGKRAGDADIARAAHGLAAAQSPKEQRAHLLIFARRSFPLDVKLLLRLVDVEQERVGPAALEALSQIAHPAVREVAFRLVETWARWRGAAINLLARNFVHGDHAIALRWFEAEDDPETLHAFGIDLLKFWQRHPDEETEIPMLRAMYEKGPCSFCRERVVRRLIARGALTGELRSECAFDANRDIRELIKQPSQQFHSPSGQASGDSD